MITLERDWRQGGGGFTPGLSWGVPGWDGIERFGQEDAAFYGARVGEGICPDFHEEDPDVDDKEPRRLIPRRGEDGSWAQCEECGALWRLRAVEVTAGQPPPAATLDEC